MKDTEALCLFLPLNTGLKHYRYVCNEEAHMQGSFVKTLLIKGLENMHEKVNSNHEFYVLVCQTSYSDYPSKQKRFWHIDNFEPI